MLKMKRPASMQAFLELVNSALIEVEELRMSMEFDMEGFEEVPTYIDVLEKQLIQLRDNMEQGNYDFADEDLPMMSYVNAQHEASLPFRSLLRLINETHRKGLESAED